MFEHRISAIFVPFAQKAQARVKEKIIVLNVFIFANANKTLRNHTIDLDVNLFIKH